MSRNFVLKLYEDNETLSLPAEFGFNNTLQCGVDVMMGLCFPIPKRHIKDKPRIAQNPHVRGLAKCTADSH